MGRYSSVQAFADNNANVRSISYEQAVGNAAEKDKRVVTEKVSNPYGSTAGAGSGEFHVYRHARAREAERWKQLEESEKLQEKEKEFHAQLEKAQAECDKKTSKNRKKRQREKEAKLRKKNMKAAGIACGPSEAVSSEATEDEFAYDASTAKSSGEDGEQVEKDVNEAKENLATAGTQIPNDGSFLEMMKRKLQENDGNEGPLLPPPAKRAVVESRIIDEDDEGPVPLP